jgi:hypothetical protein
MEIAGDYERPQDKSKGKIKVKDKPAVAQTKPGVKSDAKSETRWGAKLPSKPADCHLNIKLINLCI